MSATYSQGLRSADRRPAPPWNHHGLKTARNPAYFRDLSIAFARPPLAALSSGNAWRKLMELDHDKIDDAVLALLRADPARRSSGMEGLRLGRA